MQADATLPVESRRNYKGVGDAMVRCSLFFSIACVIRTHAVLNVQAGSHIGHADKQQGIILNSKYESELRDVRCHEGRTLGGCVRLLAHLSEMAEQC